MTFNASVPNASQSPGLFPTQNQTNMTRLKTIIDADHQFNDTAAGTDGLHNQVTLINRADPSSLGSGNVILYSNTDSITGLSQLFFYNGTNRRKISSGFDLIATSSTAINTVSGTLATVPDDSQGIIMVYDNGAFFGAGFWFSSGGIVNAYSYVFQISSSSSTANIYFLNSSSGSTNLQIKARTTSSSYNGLYSWKVYEAL